MSQRKHTPLSTHARVQREINRVMKGRDSMTLPDLRAKLRERLGIPLRVDFLAANLLGMEGYLIDTETQMLISLRDSPPSKGGKGNARP